MNKIVIKHSCIEINNYNLGDSSLEGIFSVYDRINHISIPKAIEYDEENRKLILPRGIDIYYLEGLFGEKASVDYNHDPYDKIDEVKIKYLPRDDVQKETLKFMLGESVEYRNNKACSQLSVNLNTGKGKTYCSIAAASYMGLRTAIITSSLNWLKQWKNCILEYTDVKDKEIFMISGSSSIFSILRKDMSKYKFVLISHSTINSYAKKYGNEKLSELFKHLRIGIKIYDESHLHFDNMALIDFHTNTYKTYYVTATPSRSNEDEDRIFQLYFKNIPKICLFDEENDPHTDYIAIEYNSKPSPQEISACKGAYGLDRNKYTNYILTKPNFYNIIHILLNTIIFKSTGKTLIYIATNQAIFEIRNWIVSNYPELYNKIGIYTSIIDPDIKHLELEKPIILTTTKSCGAAMDIPGLQNTIVLAELFKSEVLAKQTLGRTRAKNTKYFEVVDMGFRQINKYYLHKRPVFEKYASSYSIIHLNQDELDRRANKIIEYRKMLLEPSFYRNSNLPSLFIKNNIEQLFIKNDKVEDLFIKSDSIQ